MEVGDLRAEEDDHEAERRRGQHQPVVAVRCSRASGGRSLRVLPASADHEQRGQQQHRVGKMGDDDPGREASLTVTAPSRTCTTSSTAARRAGFRSAGSLRCRRQATTATAKHESAHQRRGPAVADLDQGREVERREPLAVAAGPVVAAPHAGAGDPDDAAEHDEPEGEAAAGPGQTPEQSRPVRRVGSSQRKRCLHRVRPGKNGPGRPLSRLHLAMPSPPAADAWGERLPRHLGLWSAIAVLVGSTIGSGIFRVPASVAERLQEPGPVLVAWVVGGVVALFGALTLAELAAALPRSGGVFAYILEGFGPAAGLSVRLVRAHRHPRLRPRRHRHDLRRVPRLLHPLHAGAGAVRGRRRHRGRWAAQLRRGEERRALS